MRKNSGTAKLGCGRLASLTLAIILIGLGSVTFLGGAEPGQGAAGSTGDHQSSGGPSGRKTGRTEKEAPSLFRLKSYRNRLVLVDWDRSEARAMAGRPGRTRVPGFPLTSKLQVELELEPFSITGPQTRFVLGRNGGPDLPIDFDASSITLFRGRVTDHPGSHVFLALSENRSTGYVDLGAGGRLFRISSRDGGGLVLQPGRTSIFEAPGSSSAPPDVPFCGVESGSPEMTESAPEITAAAIGSTRGLKNLELAVETDYEYFILFGNTTDALTYLMEMYAQVSDIYIRDVDTRIELVFARIWDDPNDLFNNVDPTPIYDFQSYWNSNMGSVTRDAAQLFSGRRDYPFGGQAFVSALCGSSAYSVVGYAMGFFPDPTQPSPYNYDISVTAHELGHNSGTGHTQDYGIDTCHDPLTTPQRGSIMSYCGQTWSGGNSNRDHYFHATVQGYMEAHINGSNCIIEDCNLNSIPDNADIQGGTSQDANHNNIPDECEDCNGNSILDDADIAGSSLDLNSNGVPDECEPDCNGNGVPDDKDIADATSTDAYGNDIPDECEADCDGDTVSDYTEIQADMTLDRDRSRVPDACQDCDTDGTPDLVALGGAHHAWVASGLTASEIQEFHPMTGVTTRTSGGAGSALADEGQDLVVTPAGHLLVSSHADNRVMEFDSSGTYLGDLVPSSGGGLNAPTGMTVTPDGTTLLVADSGTNRVLAFDIGSGSSQGTFVSAGSGGLLAPFGLIFGPNGNLFVASAANEVLEYDGQTGAWVGVFVSAADNGGLDQPRGLAFKPDGNLLVASFGTDQVLEYDGQTGAAMGRWALSGTATVLTQVSPWGIRVGPNGNVFVSKTGEDFGSGSGGAHLHLTNAQIYEFDAKNGNFLRAYINGNDHGLVFPTGFAFVPGWDIDCNLNLLPDSCDITSGFSEDIDLSGTPDECEVDCDGNGTWDRLDIIPYGTALDCNQNFSPDACDIGGGGSADCSGNGIPDECEPDCNGNLVADSCDIDAGSSMDCNGNGVPDECDIADDLEADTGWTVGAPGDDATDGIWIRVDPNGTLAQPEDDHTPGGGHQCFVTGQGAAGGPAGGSDVDGGATTLFSPALDLSGFTDPKMGYWRWFSNDTGTGPANDVFTVSISNDGGQSWTLLETVGPGGTEASGGWFFHMFRVADFVTPTSQLRLRFVAEDAGGGSNVEAAIDDLMIFPECCTTNLDCDDGFSCTLDACALAGSCNYAADTGTCFIEGACYLQGETNPANSCEECDTASPLVWTPGPPPGEVQDLYLTHAAVTQLGWTALGTSNYDIAGGEVSDLLTAGGVAGAVCLMEDVLGITWDDPRPDPPLDVAYYYMIRADQTCGVGTYGTATSEVERLPNLACP